MLLKDNKQFQLTAEQLKKYSGKFTYKSLDIAWRNEPLSKDGKPNWKTNMQGIPVISPFYFEDGSRGMLTYAESIVQTNVAGTMVKTTPNVLNYLTNGSFFHVENNPDLNFYLQNSQWLDTNAKRYGAGGGIFQMDNSKGMAEDLIKETTLTTTLKMRILQDMEMPQLLVLKKAVIDAGLMNRFREDMNKTELSFELSGYLDGRGSRDIIKEALKNVDANYNNKVQTAIERNIISYNAKDRSWSIDESGHMRTLAKVKIGANPEAIIMGYFNNNPDEQKLLSSLMALEPAL